MLSHMRRTRLVAVCFVLVTALLLLLGRSSGASNFPSFSHNKPQLNSDGLPFLHDPPPLVPQTDEKKPPTRSKSKSESESESGREGRPPRLPHPIAELIAEARFNFSRLLGKQPLTLAQAASAYRERRGRHPPPGFDKWFAAAKADHAFVVEDFFDQIYDDLAPFWAIPARELQWKTRHQPQYIRVRGGRVDFVTDDASRPPFIQRWIELIAQMMPHIPDLNMVVNVMDETRILVPWETIDKLTALEARHRRLIPPADAVSQYSPFDDGDGGEVPYRPEWIYDRAHLYWNYLSAACPPDSPARSVPALSSPLTVVEYPTTPAAYTHHGYVRNVSMARDPCLQPHLRGMHGTFVESISMATLTAPFPMFGGHKLPQNNDILIPASTYLDEDNPLYHGRRGRGCAWEKKKSGIAWRGIGSGGRNKADNWAHFHRHRLVQVLNGTTVAALEHGDEAAAPTFRLAEPDVYDVAARRDGRLGEWISRVADVGFTHLECFPVAPYTTRTFWGSESRGTLPTCPYTDPWFAVVGRLSMSEMYAYKLIPDVDGNSYSVRWRAFLRSTSTPLKATIYAEWHDRRLAPWVHYVPADISYVDMYGLLDYFLEHEGGDAHARRIAEDGRAWAEAAYRREDMKLYVWRLLLEYARVIDEKRIRLAFVGDLVGL